jgi:hypothetical protein
MATVIPTPQQAPFKRQVKEFNLHQFKGQLVSTVDTFLGDGVAASAESAADSGNAELAFYQAGAGGDEFYHILHAPTWWDLTYQVRVAATFIHINATTAAADTPIFKFFHKWFAGQGSLTDVLTSPDGTVTFDAHTCANGVATIETTAWYPTAIHSTFAAGDVKLGFVLEINNLGGASADEIEIDSLLVEYVPSHWTADGEPEF